MIPPILHQTWKTDQVPERFRAWTESWRRHNPGLTRKHWSDRALLEFVAEHYPQFLETYCSYKSGILRADAGRYLLLHHFGGVYADLDCECIASFESIMDEERVVLCTEPAEHAFAEAPYRGLPYLLFNGTMASPPKHPFWLHLLSYLPGLADAKEVLDATGPCVMTSAQLSFPDQSQFAIHPSSLFAPLARSGVASGAVDPGARGSLSVHHWAGTWLAPTSRRGMLQPLKRLFYQTRYLATRGEQADAQLLRASVDPAVISLPAPTGQSVAVLVPVRDAADHIAPFLAAVGSLDYPAEQIKLVFCEGDSTDGSWERLNELAKPLRDRFRDIVLLRHDLGTTLNRASRHNASLQRERRGGLDKVRNHLIRHGLDERDDWALWIDIDVWRFPPDIIGALTSQGRRIVVPNCVKVAGGPSFDLNSFVTVRPEMDHRYYRSVRRGLFQPPSTYVCRRHLSDLRHLERVELHGVGGTMLLVDASLHRGGLAFPEKPYRDLIETEAFGVLARDLGIPPVGLPRVEILHVPW